MKRGDFVTIALQSDFGKPRPALVIQSDQFRQHGSVTILPLSSLKIDAPLLRISVEPNAENGLQLASQIMIDKLMTVRPEKLGPAFGQIDANKLVEVERCLAVFLGITK